MALPCDEPPSPASLAAELRAGEGEGPLFAYAKVDPTRLCQIRLLEDLGCRLVDTNVQFDKPAGKLAPYAGNCTLRFAAPGDEAAAAGLGRDCFRYSRFHLDPRIGKELADLVKGEWVRNYFRGTRGDAMVLAVIQSEVVGFLQLIYQGETLVIDLIAVDERQRRKGIAGDMIRFAEEHCGSFSRVLVGTQLANVPSMRMYEGLGFKICASSYVFHFHSSEATEEQP